MTRPRLLLLLPVLAALPSLAQTPTPTVCREDAPIAAIAISEGPTGPRNVLVAVWDDGRILRSLSEKTPGDAYAQARLSPSVMEEVRATLLRMRYWKWTPSRLAVDSRMQMTMACIESREAAFEHKGRPAPSSGPGQLRDYLMRLRLPSPVRAAPPAEGDWLTWFRAAEDVP